MAKQYPKDWNRIIASWADEDGDVFAYISTLYGPDFHKELQELVTLYGAPTKVEYFACNKGWWEGDEVT